VTPTIILFIAASNEAATPIPDRDKHQSIYVSILSSGDRLHPLHLLATQSFDP
jgi:hypothetical protein